MSRTKYGKQIITELMPVSKRATPRHGHDDIEGDKAHLRLLNIDEDIVKGAFYAESVWIWPGADIYPAAAEPRTHTHEFDEIIAFIGTDTKHPHDLCGEIELWLDGEKHTLTKSCMVFVPKGMKHCPLVIKRVDRPIFHYSVGKGGVYKQENV
jgi:hypothetical protein